MTYKQLSLAAMLLCLPVTPLLAQSQAEQQQRPELFEALIRCRAIVEADAKLRCFEAATDALEQGAASGEVVVVDRAQVRESRRQLFGVTLPSLPVFGGDDEEDEINSVDGVVAAASQDRLGRWVIQLENGASWTQTDDRTLALRPRPGQTVVINRAALGTYMMRVNGQQGIRVRRNL